jgi:hypothetical protein
MKENEKMANWKCKTLSLLLALAMVLSVLPTVVLAADSVSGTVSLSQDYSDQARFFYVYYDGDLTSAQTASFQELTADKPFSMSAFATSQSSGHFVCFVVPQGDNVLTGISHKVNGASISGTFVPIASYQGVVTYPNIDTIVERAKTDATIAAAGTPVAMFQYSRTATDVSNGKADSVKADISVETATGGIQVTALSDATDVVYSGDTIHFTITVEAVNVGSGLSAGTPDVTSVKVGDVEYKGSLASTGTQGVYTLDYVVTDADAQQGSVTIDVTGQVPYTGTVYNSSTITMTDHDRQECAISQKYQVEVTGDEHVSNISLDSTGLNTATVKRGDSVSLSCTVDEHYEVCGVETTGQLDGWSLSGDGSTGELRNIQSNLSAKIVTQPKQYGYRVEYYYDDARDDSATVTDTTARYGAQITAYTDKVKSGYALDKVEGLPLTISGNAEDNVIRVYYAADSLNAKDNTPTGGDGIPDKYQAAVTYQVVNGTWGDGTTSKTEIFTLSTKDADGEWQAVSPAPTLGDTIPTATANASHSNSAGSWDTAITAATPVTGSATYTYTFANLNEYKITVRYCAEGTDDQLCPAQTVTAAHGSAYDVTDLANVAIAGYVKVSDTGSLSGTATGDVAVTVYYAVDKLGDKDKDGGDTGDGIPDKYQAVVKFVAGDNGTVTGDGTTQTFTAQQNADGTYSDTIAVTPDLTNVTVQADQGYAFDGWTENGSAVDPTATRTVSGNTVLTFTATFAQDKLGDKDKDGNDTGDGTPDKYQAVVKFVAGDNGTVTGDGTTQTFTAQQNADGTYGDTITLTPDLTNVTVQANPGYAFDGWTENGSAVDPTATRTVSGDTVLTFTAIFAEDTLKDPSKETDPDQPGDDIPDYRQIQVTFQAVNGSFDGDESYTTVVTKDDQGGAVLAQAHLRAATAAAGFRQDSAVWTKNGSSVSAPQAGDAVEDGDVFQVTFALPTQYTLSASIDNGTISGAGAYNSGATATVTFAPRSGYAISQVTVDGTATTGYAWSSAQSAYVLTVTMDGSHAVAVTTVYIGGIGSDDFYDEPTVDIEEPDVPLAGDATLNNVDHFAYIVGYTDGTVRPLNNITRQEVAVIFYRLLDDTSRAVYFSEDNDFSDVDSSWWSNAAISTLANIGVVTGYTDGTFRPLENITREEFAAMAARFAVVTDTPENPFSDTEGRWSTNLISFAYSVGWVTGYTDGTFRPLNDISRAETMAIINRVLDRKVDEAGLIPGYKQFSDNTDPQDWYYYHVIEATNSHDYERQIPGEVLEKWTALTEDKTWD